MSELKGKKIAVFVEKLYNEHEFWYPVYRLREAGAEVVIAGTDARKTYKGEHGMPVETEHSFSVLHANDLDGIVIPGGYAPDAMRHSRDCLSLVWSMNDKNKLVAFICHAGWVPVSAGIMKGRRATSVISIKDDMVNAGCEWEDKALVVDRNFVSSRGPDDLPEFMKGVIGFFKK